MALITDYTSASFNSYYTIAEVDAGVAMLDGVRDISKWAVQSATQKENLILATVRDINSYEYLGRLNPAVIAPNMQFPRSGLYYENGNPVPADEIPVCLLEYTSYRVLERIDNQDGSTSEVGQNIKKQKLGDLEQEFYNSTNGQSTSNKPTKLPSFRCIEHFIIPGTYGGTSINLIRV